MKLTDLALLASATLRLSRFVTTDSLGDWYIVQPAKEWAESPEVLARGRLIAQLRQSGQSAEYAQWEAENHPDPLTWQGRLVSGLECPFCVGFWIGGGVAASYLVARRNPAALKVWRFTAGILGMNYATAHLSARLD